MALINYDNIPNGMISGLDTRELEWVTSESAERYVTEFSDSFLNMLNSEEESFVDIDEEIINELNTIEKGSVPEATEKHTKLYVSKFRSFLADNHLSVNFEEIPQNILCNYLRFFYSKLKKNNNELYSPSTLVCIRAAIHRHLTSPDVNRNINILEDSAFLRANNMLKSMVGRYLKESKSETKLTPAIEENDMRKIRDLFDRSTPEVLQMEVWFNLTFYFGLRGRETMRQLTRTSLSIESDSDGKRFCRINHDFLSKNSKASLSKKESENIKKGRMYELSEGNEATCPIGSLELYLNKLTQEGDELFPLPLKTYSDQSWYCKSRVLGKNTLSAMMKKISSAAKLSHVYTNHSVRVTTVSVLKENGFTNDQIQTVTGHKNEQSVSRYVRQRNDKTKRSFSSALSNGLFPGGDHSEQITTASTSSTSVVHLSSKIVDFNPPPNKEMKVEIDGVTKRITVTFS